MPAPFPWPCDLRRFSFGDIAFTALIPEPAALHLRFEAGGGPAPYWARIWPASLALCQFLAERPGLIAGKRILELAAGLGLPGLLAARSAAAVTLSDIDPDAVAIMASSAAANGFQNVNSRVIDWSDIPADLRPEVVLLSDVNYDPGVFDSLFDALTGLQKSGIPVILSTPQRLMAKPFIERLQPMIRDRHEVEVNGEFMSVFETWGR